MRAWMKAFFFFNSCFPSRSELEGSRQTGRMDQNWGLIKWVKSWSSQRKNTEWEILDPRHLPKPGWSIRSSSFVSFWRTNIHGILGSTTSLLDFVPSTALVLKSFPSLFWSRNFFSYQHWQRRRRNELFFQHCNDINPSIVGLLSFFHIPQQSDSDDKRRFHPLGGSDRIFISSKSNTSDN